MGLQDNFRRKRRGASWLAAASVLPLFLALLLGSVYFYTSYQPFYEAEYAKYGCADVVGTDSASLSEITTVMIDYLTGRRDNADVQAVIHGELREVFSENEKLHLADTLYLYDLLRIALYVCVPLAAISLVCACLAAPRRHKANAVSTGMLKCLVPLTVLFGALAAYLCLDFYNAFILFHKLSFTNELWLMDAGRDVLVQMMPNGFFTDIAAYIGITFGAAIALLLVVLIIIAAVSSRRLRALAESEQAASAPAARPTADEVFTRMGISDDSAVPPDVKQLIGAEQLCEEPAAIPAADAPDVSAAPSPAPKAPDAPSSQELRDRLNRF